MVKFVRAIKDFSGGLSEVANDNIPDNRLITARNAVPGDGYGIARANGTTVAYEKITASGPVVMLAELPINDETHIIAATENSLKWNLWDWDGTDWTQAADGSQETDFDPFLSWFVYDSKLFWLDGASYWCYDGTVVAEVPNVNGQTTGFWNKIKTAVAVERRSTRWFFATTDNELIVSDVGYYDKFTETNLINITSGVNDSITALHEFNDGILIFQQRSIYYLAGWDLANGSDVNISKLSVECGTKWPKTVQTISNAVLYLGDNGVYRLSIPYYSSSIAAANISDKQASKRLSVACTDAYAEVFNGIYYITLRTSGGPKEYRYYLNSGSWWGEYTQQAYCYGARLGGENKLYIGCANGYVLYYDTASTHYISTDTGGITSIPVEIRTKGYDVVGGTVIDAKVKRAFLVLKQYDVESSGLTVQVKTDYAEGAWEAEIDSMKNVLTAVLQDVEGDESLVWDEGRWSLAYWGWIDTVTKQFQINRKCKRAQFIFRDENPIYSSEPLLIYGVALQYKKKKAKGSRLGVDQRTVRYDQ